MEFCNFYKKLAPVPSRFCNGLYCSILLGNPSFSWFLPLTFSRAYAPLTTYRESRAARWKKRPLFHNKMDLFKVCNALSVVSCFISSLALTLSARRITTEDVKGKENSRNLEIFKAVESSTQSV